MTRVSPELAKSMIEKARALSTRYEGPPIKDTCTAVPKTDRCEKVVPCAPPAHQSFEGCAPSPKPSRRFARARKPNPGGQAVSKLERDYGAHLEALKRSGEIIDYKHQPLKLRLADKTYYNPDYSVHRSDDVIELVEVKGFWEDMSRVKVKVCAERFPEFLFVAVTRPKKNEGWKREEF